MRWTAKKSWASGIITLALLVTYLSVYIVPEGHIAVVNFTGKAVRQENPGLRVKIPFIETIEVIEVRERKNVETMPAATGNQLPTTAVVSINWTVNKSAAIDLYIKYGGIDQFEERVLNPRMKSAAKAAIAHFRADQIIRDRQAVVAEIFKEIVAVTGDLPITITTAQLEDIQLPISYMDSILAKERAREDAAREQHNLDRQKLKAQQKVQTAEANRDAIIAVADGNAYKVRVEAEAQAYYVLTEYTERAKGVNLLAEQLTPVYIEYLRARKWNGVLPKTMLSEGSEVLYGINTGTDVATN